MAERKPISSFRELITDDIYSNVANSSIFNLDAPICNHIFGDAQDGVAKGASGGRVAIMKGLNHDGLRIDGSVGKSFAYGAQKGVLIVQGNADSRACIRLSGADVILGGQISHPIDDSTVSSRLFKCEWQRRIGKKMT